MKEKLKNVILLDFISGMCLGLEFFLGEDLEEDDVFAMTLHLLIVRITYIITRSNDYDDLAIK